MSGLIGGAGSKSGVIGTTELDYEEGVFTATAGSNSLYATYNVFSYVKFGKLCWISGQTRVQSSGGGYDMLISGLPFTCQSAPTNGTGNGYGTMEVYRAPDGTDTIYCICIINENTAVIRLTEVKDDGDSIPLTGENNGYYSFSITYKIA